MEENEELQSLLQNLRDAGCSDETITEFMKYKKCGCNNMQLCVLKRQRCQLLKTIHEEQKKIDCLDFLINKLKGGNECGKI